MNLNKVFVPKLENGWQLLILLNNRFEIVKEIIISDGKIPPTPQIDRSLRGNMYRDIYWSKQQVGAYFAPIISGLSTGISVK